MGSQSLTNVFVELLRDIKEVTVEDIVTISNRIKNEGVSFLTKTLRAFGKKIDSALGIYPFELQQSIFRPRGKNNRLPVFLQGLLSRIFDKNGRLLANADALCIGKIRQICYFSSKYEVSEFSDDDISNALRKFRSIESLLTFEKPELSSKANLVLERAAQICSNLLKGFNPKEIIPKHGPGAVLEKLQAHEKYAGLTYNRYRRCEDEYPFYRYYSNYSTLLGLLCNGLYRPVAEIDYEGVSLFALVPKDSRGPRTITIEPLNYQYIQQGIRNSLVPHIERTSGNRINFSDQSINRELAYLASLPENSDLIATIDLEDASDRVTNWLFEAVFCKRPDVINSFSSVRTRFISLEQFSSSREYSSGDDLIPVKRFAGMGSGICFPVEGIIFYCLTQAIVDIFQVSSFTRALGVHVYGDDIIVGSDIFLTLKDIFSELQLSVSSSKSFSTGFFKESCGGDFFLGHNVTPIKSKRFTLALMSQLKHSDPSLILSTVALSNDLYIRGFLKASLYIYTHIRNCYGKLPYDDTNKLGCLHTVIPPSLTGDTAYDVGKGYCRKTLRRYISGYTYIGSKEPKSKDLFDYQRGLTVGFFNEKPPVDPDHFTIRKGILKFKRVFTE